MASPTANNAPKPASMAPTPGVGGAPATAGTMQPMAGHVAQTPDTKGAEPMLVEGIDKVLLHRLYPDVDSSEDVAAKALAQGKETWEQGATLRVVRQTPTPTRGHKHLTLRR